MKAKTFTSEAICLLLVLYFFYQGIYKLAYFSAYAFWLSHVPLINRFAGVLKYLIPLGELALSVLLLVPFWRRNAMYASLASLVLYVVWSIAAHYSSANVYFPFQGLWKHTTWFETMILALAIAWLSLIAVIYSPNKIVSKDLAQVAR